MSAVAKFEMGEAAPMNLSIGDFVRIEANGAEYNRVKFLGELPGGVWAVGYFKSKDADRAGSRPWSGGKVEWNIDHINTHQITRCVLLS